MQSKSLLVVGGAGYVGSHCVSDLLEQGYRVIVLDNLSSGHRRLLIGEHFIQGSAGNAEVLKKIFAEHHIHAVIHFAASSIVSESVVSPLAYYANNVKETLVLLEEMVRHDIHRFIFSSSAAVYGEPEQYPIKETHACHPTNPYGASKFFIERMLADCDTAYGLKSICLRYFNAAGAHPSGRIGELHNPETHLIPIILKSALRSQSVTIFGSDYPTADGTCVRDYIHVCDLAKAHTIALKALIDGMGSAVFNIGNTIGYSVAEIINEVEILTGRPISVLEDQRRPGDPAVLIADSGRIKSELGWKPQFQDVRIMLETAWKWHTGLEYGI